MARQARGKGANLGLEAQLWATAVKLRGSMEPSDYKHVVLGLIFLKYISDAFEAKRADLLTATHCFRHDLPPPKLTSHEIRLTQRRHVAEGPA